MHASDPSSEPPLFIHIAPASTNLRVPADPEPTVTDQELEEAERWDGLS